MGPFKVIASLAVGIVLSPPLKAASIDIPFPDLRALIVANGFCNSKATGGSSGLITIKDTITMCPTGPNDTSILALTYAHFILSSLVVVGVRVVDVYGIDLNPTGSVLAESGFNPTFPEVTPGSNEEFIGISTGTDYPATFSTTTPLSDLSGVLTGLGFNPDLSAFSGDPNSIVYVFSADLPVNDATTPEPGAAMTTGFALLFLWLRGRKSKAREPQTARRRLEELPVQPWSAA